jgi:hypothetical protein
MTLGFGADADMDLRTDARKTRVEKPKGTSPIGQGTSQLGPSSASGGRHLEWLALFR